MIPLDILQSNRDLTPGERRYIKQLVQDTDEKLKTVKEAVAKLKQEEKELPKTAKNCELALAPIRMLPRDVIREIFLECVRSEEPSMSHRNAPLLLTHICSAFRDIAMSIPTLWATIALTIPKVKDDDEAEEEDLITGVKLYLRSQMDVIGKWIHLSGTVPISIKCTSRMEPHMLQRFEKEQLDFAAVLLKSVSRWRHLSLLYEVPGLLFLQIMQLTSDKVPSLSCLHISHKGGEVFDSNIFQARNLTGLSLKGFLDASNVNWSRLTELTLDQCVRASIVGILRQTRNLVRLSFYGDSMGNYLDDIYLPHLRKLSVRAIHPDSGGSVADYIYAPALKTLHADDSVTLLTNLVKRSPHLRYLKISLSYPDDAVTAWLRNCPQITSLDIAGNHWTRLNRVTGLLEELVVDQGGTYTCPNLREFRHNSVVAASSRTLCQFLGARQGRSDTLLARKWKQIYLKVFITDWGSRDNNRHGKVLDKAAKKWKRAGVQQLLIMNSIL